MHVGQPSRAKAPGLQAERDRFVAFAFAAADLLVEVDSACVIRYASGAALEMTGQPADTLIGQPLGNIVVAEDHALVAALVEGLGLTPRLAPVHLSLRNATGTRMPVLIGGCRLPSVQDRSYLTFTATNLAPATATGDATGSGAEPHLPAGMLDANGFMRVAEAELHKAQASGVDEALLLLAIDGLTNLQENTSKAEVDALVEKLGGYLRAHSVGGGTVGMLAPDRFGLVHDHRVNPDRIRAGVDALLKKERPKDPALGVKTFSIDLETEELSDADAARAVSYAIRKFSSSSEAGLDIVSLSEGTKKILTETIPRIRRLRVAIEERAFDLVFQPVVELDTRRIHHFEALSRLTGVASPAEFISFAEDFGAISDFDLAVCQKVADELSAQARAGWSPSIAVNLSAASMQSDLFVDEILALLKPFVAIRDQMLFEITETARVHDFAILNKALQKLRGNGHRLCLDDVGAGRTSFEWLYHLQVDFVKIDGLHIRKAAEDERHMSIVRSIVTVCRDLKVPIIAEQIEDEKHATTVRALGITLGQGYLYGRPALDINRQFAFAPSQPQPTKVWSKQRKREPLRR